MVESTGSSWRVKLFTLGGRPISRGSVGCTIKGVKGVRLRVA